MGGQKVKVGTVVRKKEARTKSDNLEKKSSLYVCNTWVLSLVSTA